jgi:hypothetical protein
MGASLLRAAVWPAFACGRQLAVKPGVKRLPGQPSQALRAWIAEFGGILDERGSGVNGRDLADSGSKEPPNIGLVLGGDLEEQFRLSLTLSGGDPAVFLRQPIAAGFLALTLATLMGPVVRAVRARRGG